MNLVETANGKLEATLTLIDRIRVGVFPHRHSEQALDDIRALFEKAQAQLDPNADPASLRNHCNLIINLIAIYLPVLGFVYRSKNSANAFELYGPLLRLLRELLGEDARLVMSSEWDFSPFTYGLPAMPGCVWVGLPASESSSALLTPLAGHEFGHHVWDSEGLGGVYRGRTWVKLFEGIAGEWEQYVKLFPEEEGKSPTDVLGDVFTASRWSRPHEWVLNQSEEVFCDLTGLRIFGPAYLWAFAYLLAPGPRKRGSASYPTHRQRASFLIEASERWGFAVPDDYESLYEVDEPDGYTPQQAFFLTMADGVTKDLFDSIWQDVDTIVGGKGLPLVSRDEADAVLQNFRLLVPAPANSTLAAVLYAGWLAYQDEDLWQEYQGISEKRAVVLNELVLKSAQVIEVQHLVKESA